MVIFILIEVRDTRIMHHQMFKRYIARSLMHRREITKSRHREEGRDVSFSVRSRNSRPFRRRIARRRGVERSGGDEVAAVELR